MIYKRFLLIQFSHNHPNGGINDVINSVENYLEAKVWFDYNVKTIDTNNSITFQVFDCVKCCVANEFVNIAKPKNMKLSILIPSLVERTDLLKSLLTNLNKQIAECNAIGEVEILTNIDSRQKTTGEKRNELHQQSKGDYVWFIDDDDEIYPLGIKRVLEAIKEGKDCIAINGLITTNGRNAKKWFISIKNKYEEINNVYYRYPNHITPIKRSIALSVPFPNKNMYEDYEYATSLKNTGLLKTETVISEPIYNYKYVTK